jgi:hypothetical protein
MGRQKDGWLGRRKMSRSRDEGWLGKEKDGWENDGWLSR